MMIIGMIFNDQVLQGLAQLETFSLIFLLIFIFLFIVHLLRKIK